MKYITNLILTRSQIMEIGCVVDFKIIQRSGDSVKVEFDDEVRNIKAALMGVGAKLELKIFNAKVALEELVDEVQKHHGCKGHGTSKSVLIPLEFEDGDVCDHFGIYRNDNAKIQGLQVSSYEYDWIDPEQE